MARTIIDARGTVDFSSGTGLTVSVPSTFSDTVITTGAVSMTSLPSTTTQALAASASITVPGVYTLSNVTPSGYFLPAPSTVPGGVFSFRIGTAQAHFLTGSTANALGKFLTDGQGAGSRLTFASPVIGNSLTLISDGLSFCVITRSGSFGTFAGT